MKITKIFFVPDAEEDIFDIYKYNNRNYSRENALRTVREIKSTIYRLRDYPEMGNIPSELERINIDEYREIHSAPYRIIYQIVDKNIYVHAVLDARRDLKSLLSERVLR